MNILFITPFAPYPPTSGNPIRTYNILKRLSASASVTLLTFDDGQITEERLAELRKIAREVHICTWDRFSKLHLLGRYALYPFTQTPAELRAYSSREARKLMDHLLRTRPFDIVQVEDSYMAHFHDFIPPAYRGGSAVTFHDIVFDKYARMAGIAERLTQRLRRQAYSWTMRRWEPFYPMRYNRCLTMSARDARVLQSINPRLRCEVIPNGADTRLLAQLPESAGDPVLLFVGYLGHGTNVDAILFYHQHVWPLVRQAVPGVRMHLVGMRPCAEIRKLESADIRVFADVPDVRPHYVQATACVVPLRAAGGTRLKILESMALGRPVVSTSIGCEGLDVRDGESMLIADDAAGLARQSIAILQDAGLRRRLTAAARQLAVERYDWDIIAGKLLAVYEQIGREQRRPA